MNILRVPVVTFLRNPTWRTLHSFLQCGPAVKWLRAVGYTKRCNL
jgi:hypothetical protein